MLSGEHHLIRRCLGRDPSKPLGQGVSDLVRMVLLDEMGSDAKIHGRRFVRDDVNALATVGGFRAPSVTKK